MYLAARARRSGCATTQAQTAMGVYGACGAAAERRRSCALSSVRWLRTACKTLIAIVDAVRFCGTFVDGLFVTSYCFTSVVPAILLYRSIICGGQEAWLTE
jgi:hypothetical protein